jgi:hypothetical protein
MNTRNFALVFGIAYLGAGLLGLMPGLLTPPPADAPPVRFDVMNGMLFGVFHVNLLHTLVHLAVGAWGLMAFMGWLAPRTYARSLAVIFAVLGVMGFIPGLNTLFGIVPLHGPDVWLHLGTAAVAAWFGFRTETFVERRSAMGDRRKRASALVGAERRSGMPDRRRGAYVPAA